ncbi:MAG TPA: hypothetical protein VFD31_09075 [Thermoleophilaceae bacterium]|nr:hypothetical protein [Thermoleophilaceae bacterium]
MDRLQMDSHVTVPLSQDAALVTALAGTAMPFAHSTEDQVERWLRALRLHGRVGAAMQALGVGEAALIGRAESADPAAVAHPDPDAAEHVVARAGELAGETGANTVSTADILAALFDVYGTLMDRALYERGASRDELNARIAEMDERAEAAL